MTAVLGLAPTADQQRRTDRRTWVLMYLGILVVSAFVGLMTLQRAPAPFGVPFTMLLIACVIVAVRPRMGIYLVGFFTFVTDGSISPWYPFTWPLSSQESILFTSNSIVVSPLEIVLMITMASWLLRLWIDRGSRRFVRGTLLWPVLVFTGFVVIGAGFGLATGGNRYAAIWEFRPLLYLPVVYVLVTNLFTSRREYRRLLILVGAALTINAIMALQVYSTMSETERDGLESLVAHGTAVQLGVILFAAIAVFTVPRTSSWARLLLPLAAIPVAWAWLLSQRRAAVIGLMVSLVFLGIWLWKLNRRLLLRIGPIFVLVMAAYVAAFWHSESTIGFPAQAIKTVLAPNQVSARDQGSDLYRTIENFDIRTTIHAKPLTGLGFGQKFYRPVALPDISFFPFYEYIPHNSILWIWIKMGVGGFVAMLFLFASTIRRGTQTIVSLSSATDRLVVLTATAYVVMYIVFAYVDIAWDWWSMVAVAFAISTCSEYLRLPSGDPPLAASSRPARQPARQLAAANT